ncbi:MAG: PQQ-binding-like beta-propeller repeat protein [Planctomycetes bacterium]|nr:PQQ-binding-like beta-propeller repeat protein [Planctomycetota bacterium]MCB9891734.1 PQQ-binding-like beta-propeller repeat protein [Planctomycetota bacterium]
MSSGRVTFAFALLLATSSCAQVDWPMARHDASRSATTTSSLTFPLVEAWRHVAPHAPNPAWPAPARGSQWQRLDGLEKRVSDDEAFAPVAARGRVLYGSSADDLVRCLDAATGALLWSFACDGPVRFAPVVHGDLVLVGSDDGLLRGLDVATGTLRFATCVADSRRFVPSRGRLVSAWPVRTGPVVFDDTVYATAGLFPGQGTFAAALDLDGTIRWRRKLDGVSPQGYLLASPTRLYVPTGRGTPVALDRGTGAFLEDLGGSPGSFALLAGDRLFTGPGNQGEIAEQSHEARDRIATFRGRRILVDERRSYLLTDRSLMALDRVEHARRLAERNALLAERQEVQQALARARTTNDEPLREECTARLNAIAARVTTLERSLEQCFVWQRPCPDARAILRAGDHLVVGGPGFVRAHRMLDGEVLWNAAIEGTVRDLIVYDGRLIASTEEGHLIAFAQHAERPATTPLAHRVDLETAHEDVRRALETLLTNQDEVPKFVLLLGSESSTLVAPIIERTPHHVIVVAHDVATRDRLREVAMCTGLAGSRVSVYVHASDVPSAFTSYFANVVIQMGELQGAVDPWRFVRPHGGLLARWNEDTRRFDVRERGALQGAGAWSHAYGDAGNTACSGDTRLGSELALQWFGGPGPEPMVDRHLRTAPPLYAEGLLFVAGDDVVLAVDAYNGEVLWQRTVERFARMGFPLDAPYFAYDAGRLFAACGDTLHVLDANTGDTVERHPIDSNAPRDDVGWIAIAGQRLFATTMDPHAARRVRTREEVDVQYRDAQPVVIANTLHAFDVRTHEELWQRQGAFVHPTLAATERFVAFVEGSNAVVNQGRATLRSLIAQGADLVLLDNATGRERWRVRLDDAPFEHSLFAVLRDDVLILSGAHASENETRYETRCYDPSTGTFLWRANHPHARAGIGLAHGEQVQHPVLFADRVLVDPNLLDLATGQPLTPDETPWRLGARRGCGTFSGASTCVFFRDHTPTWSRIDTPLAPRPLTTISRPSCWISTLPAGGLVLLPEGSSGCVCAFPLQTSMAFLPRADLEPAGH